ncbi:hypothetical protein QYF36_015746 [Acer negundo]|nr:hypothetical protein QYF36_015746 [Acer negundo]
MDDPDDRLRRLPPNRRRSEHLSEHSPEDPLCWFPPDRYATKFKEVMEESETNLVPGELNPWRTSKQAEKDMAFCAWDDGRYGTWKLQ